MLSNKKKIQIMNAYAVIIHKETIKLEISEQNYFKHQIEIRVSVF